MSIIGQLFFSYQWDTLLLEAGFIAILLAPSSWRVQVSRREPVEPAALLLMRWLVFRLMFLSGFVKLASGDTSWRELSALEFHYLTQPLPNPLAYYAHFAPRVLHYLSTGGVLVIELLLPFAIFLPRRFRLGAAIIFIGFQAGIFLTGNYTFFNLLTAVICLSLFDDSFLKRIFGRKIRETPAQDASPTGSFSRALLTHPLALLLFILSCTRMSIQIAGPTAVPKFLQSAIAWTSPFRSVNSYGLFAVMTTRRLEIVIEGSRDGEHWEAYEFKSKPGAPEQPLPFVAPHQPRLDWQMWFAALRPVERNPWFILFIERLLNGSEPVLSLLKHNPFPENPPTYIRALLYDYTFASPLVRKTDGMYWSREIVAVYLAPVSIDDFLAPES